MPKFKEQTLFNKLQERTQQSAQPDSGNANLTGVKLCSG